MNWVKLMKQKNIRVPQGRFEYYIQKLHNSSSVSERIILKELWDPNIHKIDKKYYIEGLIPFLSICLDKSVKETKELLDLLIERNTQNNLDKYIVSNENRKRKNINNEIDKSDNKKYKQSCIDSFFNK
jgi:DNA polymerase elongation subunit (family B)